MGIEFDSNFVNDLKNNDEKAWKKLKDYIYLQISKKKNIQDDYKEDILQETMIKIIRYIDTFNPVSGKGDEQSNFKRWIKTCLENCISDFFKRTQSQIKLESDIYLGEEEEENSGDIYDAFDTPVLGNKIESPSEYTECVQTSEIIEDFLKKYKGKHKNVFWLNRVYGYTTSEISKMLGINENTISTIISRIQKDLKEYLRKRGYII